MTGHDATRPITSDHVAPELSSIKEPDTARHDATEPDVSHEAKQGNLAPKEEETKSDIIRHDASRRDTSELNARGRGGVCRTSLYVGRGYLQPPMRASFSG
jgi:hypothetical protein